MSKLKYDIVPEISTIRCYFSDECIDTDTGREYADLGRVHMIHSLAKIGERILKDYELARSYAISFIDCFERPPMGIAYKHPEDEWDEEVGKKVALRKLLTKFTEMRMRYCGYVEDRERERMTQICHEVFFERRKYVDLLNKKRD